MMFEIIKNIVDIKKLLELNDICFVIVYKFRIVEFWKLFLYIKVKFLIFFF